MPELDLLPPKAAVTTAVPSVHAQAAAPDSLQDSLKDPLTDPLQSSDQLLPPVDKPLCATDLVHMMGTIGTLLSSPNANIRALATVPFSRMQQLQAEFRALDVMQNAGQLDPSKACSERVHILTQLDASLSVLPGGLDPRIDAFKERVKAELAKGWEEQIRHIEEQAERNKQAQLARDTPVVEGIRERLMSASR